MDAVAYDKSLSADNAARASDNLKYVAHDSTAD
jgi:hypothetical protein